MATIKTNTLCQLWGVTPSIINEKLMTLKSIIGDISDIILLDYLTKCDLDIEQCINLHFSQNNNHQSPSPQISHNNNNHNISNNDELLLLPNNSNNANNANNTTKRKLMLWDELTSECDTFEIRFESKKNKNKKRKLQRPNNSNSSQPKPKKRKLSQTNNTNNSNSKQERDSDDEKYDVDMTENNIIPIIPSFTNWKNLEFGSFTIQYRNVAQYYKFKLSNNCNEWFKESNDKLDKLYGESMIEINQNGNTKLNIKKKTNEIADNFQETTFNISYQRPLLCASKVNDELNTREGFGATLAIINKNNDIYNDYVDTNNLLNDFKKTKNGQLTLETLLDFSCKYKYKSDATNNTNLKLKYKLNVNLYPYQLQTIEYMIKEENNPIGFYRHLYKMGTFENNNSFYYYSSAFKRLIINQHLPNVHGGFICEEMGLGKTIEMLALINYNQRKGECSNGNKLIIGEQEKASFFFGSLITDKKIYYKSRATLIIAPVSLVGQWEKECVERSVKKISFMRYYASYRKRDVCLYIDRDIVFTTYGIIGMENGEDRKKHILHCIQWHRIVLDESHYIKNGNTKCSKNIHKLRGNNKWLLTGTPFGRQVYDIYNQLKFLGLTEEDLDYKLNFSILKKKVSKSQIAGNEVIPFLKVMKYVMMRHKKAQKFNDLEIVKMTDKDEDIIYIKFSAQQKIYYDKLYATAKERYDTYAATGNIGRGSIAILASLHPARQACSGHIYSKDEIEKELSLAQAKTYRVQQMVSDESNFNKSAQELYEMALFSAYNMDESECPICYETPFDDPLQTSCRHIFCGECIRAILNEKPECPMCRKHCTVRQLKKPPSKEILEKNKNKNKNKNTNKTENKMDIDEMIRFDTKLMFLIDEINKLKNKKETERDKSLIFTSFSKSLDWICAELEKNGIEYRTLTGSMSMNKRKKALQEFQNNDNVKVFVLTVRSGAVGITLTAANHVYLMEPPFNPALYRQAINRAYRLGQKKTVFIRTLIMKDSIEERIWNVNKDKQNINGMAGNIKMDKSAKLLQHEISKLFQ